MKLTHSLLTLSLAGTLAFSGRVALAADGITDSEIKLGMCNALTGNSAALGTGMKAGASAFFAKLNAAGGVNGRQLTLVSYDDGYEPQRTIAQTTKLIDEDKVFALFGYVGTPTSAAILPQLAKSGIPFLAPYTGAEMLRNPVRKNIFNVRASYFDETEGLVERLTTDLGAKSIGVFVQDDAYGAAGEAGVVKALRKRGLTLAGKGVYTRNTVEVAAGLAALTQAKPDAVIMIGSYKACAAFVKQAKAGGFGRETRPRLRGLPSACRRSRGGLASGGASKSRSTRNVQGARPVSPGWRKAGHIRNDLGLAQGIRGPVGLRGVTPGGKQERGRGTGRLFASRLRFPA